MPKGQRLPAETLRGPKRGCGVKKSQAKQALLAIVLGPAGLFYSSVNVALLLILITLIGVLVVSSQSLYVLIGSFLLSVLCGWVLVRAHNRHIKDRDFALSTYIGRVSCRVIGTTRFKRDYTRPLAIAKFKRRLRSGATYGLATLCVVITAYIAMPNAKRQIDTQLDGQTTDAPEIAAASALPSLSNIGVWLYDDEENSRHFQARLQSNNYQATSEGYYRPTLSLNCDSGHATVSFNAYEVLGTEDTMLTLNFDTTPEESYHWALNGDYRSAYTPASKPLLKKLTVSEHLQINYRPFGAAESRSIDFSLGKSAVATGKLQNRCA